jgi:hypothetical protein
LPFLRTGSCGHHCASRHAAELRVVGRASRVRGQYCDHGVRALTVIDRPLWTVLAFFRDAVMRFREDGADPRFERIAYATRW